MIVFPVVVVLGEMVVPDTPVPSPKIAGLRTLSAEAIASSVALTGAAVVGVLAPASALPL